MLRIIFLSIACLSQTAFGVKLKTVAKPFIRANQALENMRVDPKGRFIAYTADLGLSILDSKTMKIYSVSKHQVGQSFFWSPDGFRLFYREHRSEDGKTISSINAYDCALKKNVPVDKVPYRSGLLTFDPRDLRMHLMTPAGIRNNRIYFPDERLAQWQISQRTENGKFIATQNGILWLTQAGQAMRKLQDDGSKVQSYDISPDGQTIAWATEKSRIYVARDGFRAKFLDYGRDPRWHPDRALLVYAGARMVGTTPVSYDIKISDQKGSSRFLTSSQFSEERWPQWFDEGRQIIYTKAKTTDVFLLEFRE